MAAPNLHILNELKNSQFSIGGGMPGLKISWQVTGIRKDPWAEANRIEVEEPKNAKEHGYFLHPELYKQSLIKAISILRHPRNEIKSRKNQD